jgi:aryl-alcohol dehydrogenase-like predicted oxidoreductase
MDLRTLGRRRQGGRRERVVLATKVHGVMGEDPNQQGNSGAGVNDVATFLEEAAGRHLHATGLWGDEHAHGHAHST